MENERVCKICGNASFYAGFCVGDGEDCYCSEECLKQDYTPEEWAEMYESGCGYWTEWEE